MQLQSWFVIIGSDVGGDVGGNLRNLTGVGDFISISIPWVGNAQVAKLLPFVGEGSERIESE
jgi:hypothetical protein